MTTDKNEFFREASLRLCGSLDIERALSNCLVYLRQVLPADEIMVLSFDDSLSVGEILATADATGGHLRSVKLPLKRELRDALVDGRHKPAKQISEQTYLAHYLPSSVGHSSKAFVRGEGPVYLGRRAHVVVVEDWGAGDPGGLAGVLKWPPSSVLLGALFLEEKEIGAIILRAAGKGRYTAEHAELWSLLNEPAGIALSNYRRYLEMLRLQDLLTQDNKDLRARLRGLPQDEIIGAEQGLRDVMSQIDRVAPLESPVLIMGETGTGKELIVNAIHKRSRRAKGPFVAVNCGAIPDTLLDSELFGHERGAFTGAVTQRKGFFERAHGGTIFLDEVGELPREVQARLLRVLQEKQFERVGGTETVSVDIRVVAATHRDLPQMVADGSFREDLYFRLSVFPINVPPLRERKDDIPALVHHFLELKGRQIALDYVPSLAPEALDCLFGYAWPGNVRELENVVERALILSRGEPLTFEELGGAHAKKASQPSVEEARVIPLQETEATAIRRALAASGGRVGGKGGAADLLDIDPGTLRHRMRKLGIAFGRKAKSDS